MEKVRLAVIGAGVIGKKHISRILADPGAELCAIADPVPGSEAYSTEVGAKHYADFNDMLARARPDGVVVATPTEVHGPPALAALEAGAHVLIEKPITATVEEAEGIAKLAESKGLHVMVGHHRRYYPLVEKCREMINDGTIGNLLAVNAQWTVSKVPEYYAPDWRKKREAGPVLTNLIHEMDLLRFMCGEVETVQASMNNAVRGFEKEDTAALVMKFRNGALCTVLISDGASSPWAWELDTGENPAFPPAHQNAYRIIGSRAALEFPNLAMWSHRDGEYGWSYPIYRHSLRMDLGDAYVLQCAHFCEVIRGNAEPRISARDAIATLAATVAVFEAAETGSVVRL